MYTFMAFILIANFVINVCEYETGHTYVYVCMYAYTHTHTCVYVCMYMLMYMYIRPVYVFVFVRTGHPGSTRNSLGPRA